MREIIDKVKRKSYIFNFFIAIIKIIIGLFIHFYSFCISAIYNMMQGISKYNTKIKESNKIGYLIMISGILYITYSIYIISKHINTNYSMYMGILIAAITFTDIGISLYGIIKAKKGNDFRKKQEKQLNLCSAIISLSLTQQAIMSFTNPGKDISLFVGIGGIVFASITIVIGIIIQISLLNVGKRM